MGRIFKKLPTPGNRARKKLVDAAMVRDNRGRFVPQHQRNVLEANRQGAGTVPWTKERGTKTERATRAMYDVMEKEDLF